MRHTLFPRLPPGHEAALNCARPSPKTLGCTLPPTLARLVACLILRRSSPPSTPNTGVP
jgi:hypothetical protein